MTKHPTPVFAGPTPVLPDEPVAEDRARAERSSATDGWLARFLRGGSINRRNAAADRERS